MGVLCHLIHGIVYCRNGSTIVELVCGLSDILAPCLVHMSLVTAMDPLESPEFMLDVESEIKIDGNEGTVLENRKFPFCEIQRLIFCAIHSSIVDISECYDMSFLETQCETTQV